MCCCFHTKLNCCSLLWSRVATDYTEIKNDFMASRESLPVMFIATPKDKITSMWTKRGPSVQVSGRANARAQLAQQHILIDSTQCWILKTIMYYKWSITEKDKMGWWHEIGHKHKVNYKQRCRKELHVLGKEQSHSFPILEPFLSAHCSPGSHCQKIWICIIRSLD